jgi:hypothetical protein
MRKTFGSAFALIMVALFTVAPISPASALGPTVNETAAIHLHMAGKVGQKAVGTTIMAGTAGFTTQYLNPTNGTTCYPGSENSGCVAIFLTPAGIYLGQVNSAGTTNPIDPFPPGPAGKQVAVTGGEQDTIFRNGAAFTIPASGNSYFQTALPTLAAGDYMLSFTAINNQNSGIGGAQSYGTAMTLQWIFTIASDGTFSSISAF